MSTATIAPPAAAAVDAPRPGAGVDGLVAAITGLSGDSDALLTLLGATVGALASQSRLTHNPTPRQVG